MGTTTIEWARNEDGSLGATWSPVRGCTRISPGCGGKVGEGGCYAEKIAARFSGEGHPFHGFAEMRDGVARWTRKVALIRDQLSIPLRRRKPQTYFVNSMGDTFHESLSNEDIGAIFGVMAACPQHRFDVLTKRADRLPKWFEWIAALANERPSVLNNAENVRRLIGVLASQAGAGMKGLFQSHIDVATWPLPNVTLGVSVESAAYKWRIDELRKVPAARRFLSIEPLLEDVGELDLTGIASVVVGCESGHGARPMNDDWVRRVRDQCVEQNVRFMLKQKLDARGHKISLPMLDGRQWADVP
jgi:protein gp37